jgi:glycerol-3-phosphate O-acyltransferase
MPVPCLHGLRMAKSPKTRLSLARFIYPVLGRMMRLLVRERVLPGDLKIEADKPICYVLESNALSNALILQQACKASGHPLPLDALSVGDLQKSRSILALQTLEGVLARRPDLRKHLEHLTALVRVVENNPELDIQLIPVSVFVGRAPDKNSGSFKILFSEDWEIAGRTRRLIRLLLHGNNTLVQFSKPISLRVALDEELGRARTVRKVSRLLRVHFRRARTAAVGPDLSHRRTLIDEIVRSRSVREAIKNRARKRNLKVAKAHREARKYALEIAADASQSAIRLFSRLLDWFWNRIYDGVYISHLDSFLEVSQGTEIIYVPCHRSHIDYLLISHLVYQHGLQVPHIAAGINLNMPLVGTFLRRCGAFYIRRSFRSNALYGAVFREYLDNIFLSGVSMEYFIEGGRSRTGRVLQPRTGMLAMTVRSYLQSRQRPVVFVPIYVGYERLVEGGSYLGELSGGRKKEETLGGLMRSFSLLREQFGQVHVSFGEAVFLDKHLDTAQPGWRDETIKPDDKVRWLSSAVDSLAGQILRNINAAAVVSPINLLAMSLLAAPKKAMAEQDLAEQMDLLRSLLLELPYSDRVIVTEMAANEIIPYAEKMGAITRRDHPLGDVICCTETQAWLLSYFLNNVLHLLAVYSWCACAFLNNITISRTELLRAGRAIYPFLRSELFLSDDSNQFSRRCEKALKVLTSHGLLVSSGNRGLLQRAPGGSRAARQLKTLARGIFNSLERYYITIALLMKNGSGSLSAQELENLCHLTAQRMSMIYTFETPEFFDKALFKHFIRMLRDAGVVDTDEAGKLTFDESLMAVIEDAKLILSKEVRHNIWDVSPAGQ